MTISESPSVDPEGQQVGTARSATEVGAGAEATAETPAAPVEVVAPAEVGAEVGATEVGDDQAATALGSVGRGLCARKPRRCRRRRAPGAAVDTTKPPRREVDRLQGWLLRVGMAFVFAYAAVSCLFDPLRFLTYLPSFVPESMGERVCLPVFSAYEVLLAVCLLTGRRLVVVSLLSAATVGSIVVTNLDVFDLLFRNVAIMFGALSLAVMAWDADRRPAAAASSSKDDGRALAPAPTAV